MPDGNPAVGAQISVGTSALIDGLFGGLSAATPWSAWPVKAALLIPALVGGGAASLPIPGNAGYAVGTAQLLATVGTGAMLAAFGLTSGLVLPVVAVAAASYVAGEFVLYAYENSPGFAAFVDGTVDLTGAALNQALNALKEFNQQLGESIASAFESAMEAAGDFVNDFANALSNFIDDFKSALQSHLEGLGDAFSDFFGPDPIGSLFGPDGPFGPDGIFGPDGVFGPDSPFGPFGLAGPIAPLGLLNGLGDLLADILSDPLVLDLDGDGVELVPLAQSTTMFDLDGDGVAERVGWASPHDGLLVQDANGNGAVDGVAELFGSANVDGFDELKTLDANNDGRIDALDPAFAELRVWRDVNSDGVSSPDEILSLAQAGITRFNLAYSQTNTNIGGNVIARTGSYVRADGTSRTMSSIPFGMDESGSLPTIPEDASDRLDMAA